MTYQIGHSYQISINLTDLNRIVESERMVGIIMLSFACGRLGYDLIISKLFDPSLYMIIGICSITLFVHTLVSYLFYTNYNFCWIFPALLFGLQDGILAKKNDVDLMEKSEQMHDLHFLGKMLGGIFILCIGAVLRQSKPFNLLSYILMIFIITVIFSLVNMNKEMTLGKVHQINHRQINNHHLKDPLQQKYQNQVNHQLIKREQQTYINLENLQCINQT